MAVKTVFHRSALAALAAGALVLAGCGTTERESTVGIAARTLVGLAQAGRAAPPTAAPVITPEIVAVAAVPLILVATPDLGGAALFTRVGENGGVESWRSPEQVGVNLTGSGILRSTRGLGFDLMAAEVTTDQALAARGGETLRRLVHLDGDRQEVRSDFHCSLRIDGPETIEIAQRPTRLTRATETCRSGEMAHRNTYWIDAAGTARRSLQWASAEVGMLEITYLTP